VVTRICAIRFAVLAPIVDDTDVLSRRTRTEVHGVCGVESRKITHGSTCEPRASARWSSRRGRSNTSRAHRHASEW